MFFYFLEGRESEDKIKERVLERLLIDFLLSFIAGNELIISIYKYTKADIRANHKSKVNLIVIV